MCSWLNTLTHAWGPQAYEDCCVAQLTQVTAMHVHCCRAAPLIHIIGSTPTNLATILGSQQVRGNRVSGPGGT
jgi:hypothetical protein